jgi:hypothetical protein
LLLRLASDLMHLKLFRAFRTLSACDFLRPRFTTNRSVVEMVSDSQFKSAFGDKREMRKLMSDGVPSSYQHSDVLSHVSRFYCYQVFCFSSIARQRKLFSGIRNKRRQWKQKISQLRIFQFNRQCKTDENFLLHIRGMLNERVGDLIVQNVWENLWQISLDKNLFLGFKFFWWGTECVGLFKVLF